MPLLTHLDNLMLPVYEVVACIMYVDPECVIVLNLQTHLMDSVKMDSIRGSWQIPVMVGHSQHLWFNGWWGSDIPVFDFMYNVIQWVMSKLIRIINLDKQDNYTLKSEPAPLILNFLIHEVIAEWSLSVYKILNSNCHP